MANLCFDIFAVFQWWFCYGFIILNPLYNSKVLSYTLNKEMQLWNSYASYVVLEVKTFNKRQCKLALFYLISTSLFNSVMQTVVQFLKLMFSYLNWKPVIILADVAFSQVRTCTRSCIANGNSSPLACFDGLPIVSKYVNSYRFCLVSQEQQFVFLRIGREC